MRSDNTEHYFTDGINFALLKAGLYFCQGSNLVSTLIFANPFRAPIINEPLCPTYFLLEV